MVTVDEEGREAPPVATAEAEAATEATGGKAAAVGALAAEDWWGGCSVAEGTAG